MKKLAILLLVFGAFVFARGAVAADRLPNVVFLFADDLGYGDVGCYGHPYARTPHIDKLAKQGTRFTQAYVTGVTCCPSRTGFMTGKFPATFKHYPADGGFGDRVTITELLQRRGYATGHFGKWHIGPNEAPGTYGIDDISGGVKRSDANENRDTGLYSSAIEFIKANKDRPFYVNVWGHITHYPVNPPEHFADRFQDVTVKAADFGPSPTMREKIAQVRGLGKDLDRSMRNYLGDVSSLDDEVGRVLETLDELGLRDNTIVVFSSDHGPAPVVLANDKQKKNYNATFKANMLGSPGPFRGGKHEMLEGGVRVPFIVRWPGRVPADRVDRDSVISGIDWLPTLCAIAGVKIDVSDFDGEDVSAAWLGEATHTRTKPLLWRVSSPKASAGIRSGRWKLYEAGRGRKTVELYDVINDPLEQNNLARSHPQIVDTLTATIDAWKATLPDSYIKPDKKKKSKRKKD